MRPPGGAKFIADERLEEVDGASVEKRASPPVDEELGVGQRGCEGLGDLVMLVAFGDVRLQGDTGRPAGWQAPEKPICGAVVVPSDGLEPSTPSLRRPVPRWHSSKDRLFVYARR